MAVIDLDDFKLWNDTYGHGTGDVVLQTVVKAIRQSTRKTDSLVRYGGDEFLLVMPDVSDEVFMKKLEYIQKQIRDADIPGFFQNASFCQYRRRDSPGRSYGRGSTKSRPADVSGENPEEYGGDRKKIN